MTKSKHFITQSSGAILSNFFNHSSYFAVVLLIFISNKSQNMTNSENVFYIALFTIKTVFFWYYRMIYDTAFDSKESKLNIISYIW